MSDPKNKWTRPQAPPAPMFFGEKERNLVKQVNDELSERVLGQRRKGRKTCSRQRQSVWLIE